MADRYVMDANAALNPVYQQANQQLASQVPQTQALYDSLIGALQTGAQQSTADIVADAAMRGLTRPTLATDTQTTLDDATMQAAAQIRRKKAEEEAALLQSRGQLAAQNVQSANTLAETSQNASQTEQRAQMAALEAQRDFDTKNLALTRQDELQRMQAARSAAQQSAKSAASSAQDEMYDAMDAAKGKDGYISPKEWNRLRNEWKSAGLSLRKFDNNSAFKKFVNPVHQKSSKGLNYKGQSIKDRRR